MFVNMIDRDEIFSFLCELLADAMSMLKSTYDVKRDWQGDPCVPEFFSWEGLNCRKDGYDPPRIISL